MTKLLSTLLFVFSLCTPLRAQVDVMYTPIPTATANTWGPRNGVYIWNIAVWNHSNTPIRITPEAITISSPEKIPFLTAAQGLEIFTQKVQASKKSRAIRIIGYAAMGATVVTGGGLVTASARVVGALAMGTEVAHEVSDRIAATQPSTTPIISMLITGPVTLAPGESTTRVMFAGITKGATVQKVVVDANLLK